MGTKGIAWFHLARKRQRLAEGEDRHASQEAQSEEKPKLRNDTLPARRENRELGSLTLPI